MMAAKQINVCLAYCATHKYTRQWVGSALIIIGLFTFHPASAADLGRSGLSSESNSLVLCLPTGVDSLDPTNHRSRVTQIVLKNIFDSLTTRDSANEVIPQLAESWRLIDDTQWQFKLRRGVRFHNGHSLTAADVKFTLDRVVREGALDGHTSPRKSLLEPISQVIVEDDLTLAIKTRHHWPNLPLMLSMQEIVPATYMKAVGSQGFEAHPVGTGPFKFIRTKAGNEIVLERFEGYYGGSPRRPPVQRAPLKQLIFKVVPSQLDRLAMLKGGRCDIIFNLPPESIPILNMSPGIRIIESPATRSYFAEINCTRPPLNDRRVRQALNYAVDIEMMVRHKLQGHGKILATVLLPNAFGYNSHLHPYPYNPSVARRLLDGAAFPDDRTIVIYSNRDDLVLADSIALFLTKLGLQTRLMIAPTFRPRIMGPDAPWDIFVGSWGNSTLDPTGIFSPKFMRNAYGNFSGFASPDLDSLMLKAQRTMDKALRTDYYHQIQAILFKEAPMIFGYAADEYYGVAKRVKNFRPSASGMIDLHDVVVNERE
jgi:peptide/nickel transport system substrate-binding protein